MTEDAINRIITRSLLLAAGLVALLFFAFSVLDIFILAFGATVLAVLIRAASEPIARLSGMPDRAAVIIVILLFLGALALIGWLFGGELGARLSELIASLPGILRDLRDRIQSLPGASELIGAGGEAGGSMLSRFGNAVMMISRGVTDLLLVLFGSAFIALDPRLYRKGIILLFPKPRRELADTALCESGAALRRWLLGQLISMTVIGVATGVGLWLIGVPFAAMLGLIAGLLEFIPYAGPILSAIPILLMAFADSPETALWALILIIAIQQAESDLLTPMVHKTVVSLPPALTVFGVVAMGILFGPPGLLFATPLLLVGYVMVKRLYVIEVLDTPTPIPGQENSSRARQ